jgi:hypothetical protein
LRRIGTIVQNGNWRRLITLVCLFAFVFVAVAHACHHVAPLGEQAASAVLSTSHGSSDESEPANADAVCLTCVLTAAEITSVDLKPEARTSICVETRAPALTTRSIPAEFPPPIA